jgi:Tol biopolymer transport system component
MIKKINIFILFIAILTGCGFKEEKLPANVDFTNTILFTAQTDDKYKHWKPQIFAVKVDSPHTLYQLTDTRYCFEDPVWLPDGSGIVFLGRMYDNNGIGRFSGDGYIDERDKPDIFVLDTTGIMRIIKCWHSMSNSEREKYKELDGLIFYIAPTSSGKIISDLSGYKFIIHDNIQTQTSFNVIKINRKLGHFYGGFSLSPDEKEIAFATQLDEDIKKVPYPAPDSISPGAYQYSFTEIFVMSIEDGEYRRLTYNNLPDRNPCWSNNGKKIYFDRTNDWSARIDSKNFPGDIFVMDSDGRSQKNLTNSPDISESSPKVSPDDKFIAYIVDEMEYDKYTEIWVMNNDGTNKRKIIGLHAYNYGKISWYPKNKER